VDEELKIKKPDRDTRESIWPVEARFMLMACFAFVNYLIAKLN
jgi:hypothetical protein